MRKLIWITLVIIIVPKIVAADNFDFQSYKRADINAINKIHMTEDIAREGEKTFIISGGSFKYNVICMYTDEIRKITDKRKMVIKGWLTSFVHKDDLEKMYENEIHVFWDGKEYWLPFQQQLLNYMKKELISGDYVNFFIVYSGMYHHEAIFLINEFKKGVQPKSFKLNKNNLIQNMDRDSDNHKIKYKNTLVLKEPHMFELFLSVSNIINELEASDIQLMETMDIRPISENSMKKARVNIAGEDYWLYVPDKKTSLLNESNGKKVYLKLLGYYNSEPVFLFDRIK